MNSPKDLHDLYFVVAEDDADSHFRIRQAIKNNDPRFIVTSVFNGVQLLDLLLGRGFYQTDSYRAPDVIILDLQMHLMDGVEALREIKKEPSLRSIPVYTFSEAASEATSAAISMGAAKVYEMPASPEGLDAIVDEICKAEAFRKYGENSA